MCLNDYTHHGQIYYLFTAYARSNKWFKKKLFYSDNGYRLHKTICDT